MALGPPVCRAGLIGAETKVPMNPLLATRAADIQSIFTSRQSIVSPSKTNLPMNDFPSSMAGIQ